MNAPCLEIRATLALILLVTLAVGTAAPARQNSASTKSSQSSRRVRTISDLAEPQGVFYDASTNRLFVACGLDGTTKIYDGTTFQLLKTVKFPDDADNIRYDARNRHVIVSYAGAKSLRKREEGQ